VTHPPPGASKADWRTWAHAARSGVDWEQVGRTVAEVLKDPAVLAERATVLSYLPMGDEVDLTELHRIRTDIDWLVTRTPIRGGLTVHPLDSVMETHRYGFSQPVDGSRPVDVQAIDIALVPGLVFDTEKNRLGHGGGYYDRLLATLRPDALRIGIAASIVVVDHEIPTGAYDLPVHKILTEDGFI